ncbi:MAG: hypothetical protein FRX48_00233 [Lasallia pustulata]|uniref:Rhodopsin domain-containing protein n=1 Tax=Lasallia pustulata TaxID=136370 RepID=A0A5M8Q0C5_9LECA|nr:MAG: hypothetical protein FRX48_00233 [Lasallia pustulata]
MAPTVATPPPSPSMLLGPVIPPPPGIIPNFNTYNHHERDAINGVIACTVLCVSFLLMRLWTKAFVTRQLWWDDYTCVIALLFVAGYNGGAIMQTTNGEGRHLWDIQLGIWHEKWSTGFQVWNAVGYSLYMVAMGTIKLSILLLYLKLLAPGMKLRFAVYGILAFVALYTIGLELAVLFACHPIIKLYHYYTPGRCDVDLVAHALTQGSLNIVSDLLIIIVPIPMVWSMQMSKQHKIGVVALFGTGLVVTALSMYRLHTLVRLNSSLDVTINQWETTIISLIEINLTLIASCMPSFKPFIRHLVACIPLNSTQAPSSPSSAANARHSRLSFIRFISKPSKPVHTTNSKELVFIDEASFRGDSDRNVSLASLDVEKPYINNGRLSSIEETRDFRSPHFGDASLGMNMMMHKKGGKEDSAVVYGQGT